MVGIYQAWQTGLLWVCLCALGAMAALLFLAKVAAPAWDAVRRWWSLPCIQRILVGVCVVGLSYYGATKQGWHVGYDGGIKAGATANVVTNDTVAIYWQRDTSGGVYVPETATVYIDAIEHGSSNVVNIAQTTVGAWGWSGTVENATNYDYTAWAYYIPPEPVHTNGVWTYKTHFDRNGEYALPLRARVEVNGVAIATPKEKRKDAVPTARDYIQDGLVAMWDGIENAGWGTHNASATTWKDLVGSGNLSISANSDAWANDAFLVRSANNIASAMYGGISSDTVTFEIVWDVVSVSGNNWNVICMNLFSDDSSAFQIGWTTSGGYSRYYGGSSYYPLTKFRVERFPTSGFLSISHVFSKSKATTVFTNGANANATRITSQFAQYPHYIRLPDSRYASGFNASIHSVRIYSRALTAEEIQHNHKIDKERFNLP